MGALAGVRLGLAVCLHFIVLARFSSTRFFFRLLFIPLPQKFLFAPRAQYDLYPMTPISSVPAVKRNAMQKPKNKTKKAPLGTYLDQSLFCLAILNVSKR